MKKMLKTLDKSRNYVNIVSEFESYIGNNMENVGRCVFGSDIKNESNYTNKYRYIDNHLKNCSNADCRQLYKKWEYLKNKDRHNMFLYE